MAGGGGLLGGDLATRVGGLVGGWGQGVIGGRGIHGGGGRRGRDLHGGNGGGRPPPDRTKILADMTAASPITNLNYPTRTKSPSIANHFTDHPIKLKSINNPINTKLSLEHHKNPPVL